MDDVEQQVMRLQKSVEDMVEGIQRQFVIPLQKAVFLCSANCCDTAQTSQGLQSCVERCSRPIQIAQQATQNILAVQQEVFQRCAARCEDKARDALPSRTPSDSEMRHAQDTMKSCVSECVREYQDKLPKIRSELEHELKRLSTR